MRAQVLGAAVALLVFAVVLRLVVKHRLLVKYAALWLVVSVLLVGLALVPGALDLVATTLGFVVPANLLFFTGFGLLLFVALQLSVEMTRVEASVQRLAEEVAILKENGERDSQ